MPKPPILRSQANEIFGILQSAGLRPTEFAWKHSYLGGTPASRLTHGPSDYYFEFEFDGDFDLQYVTFSPAVGKLVGQERVRTWSNARDFVRIWAEVLSLELSEIDLWESIATEKVLNVKVEASPVEDTPFDPVEQQRIRANLNEIKEYLESTQQLDDEQREVVTARLAYLEDASTRLGRKDWVLVAIGVITNIIVTGSFSPTQAHELLQFAGRVLGWVVAHKLLLP